MNDITFEQIRAFLAVAKYGSFSIAAEKVYRTQAALSIQVARLEETAGTRMFDRSTKQVALTSAGEVMRRYLLQVEQSLQQAETELGDLQQLKKGRLVLCTSDTTACYRLPRILQEFHREFPGVELIVRNATSPKTRELVKQSIVDVGIVTLDTIPAKLESRPLFPRADVVICPPHHQLSDRQEVFLKDLEAYSCILLDGHCSTRQILDRKCHDIQVTLNITMELSSVEVIKRFVRIDAGISIVPEVAVQEEVANGQLVSLRICEYRDNPPIHMGVVYRKDRYLSSAARVFLERLARMVKPG
jgi:DNA-binding transcriptional LysR family regulator